MNNGPNTDNRRSAYRVCPKSTDDLDLAILGQRQQIYRGTVADVAIGGARVNLESENAPELDLGSRINLAVSSKRFDYSAELAAHVVSTSAAGSEHSVGLQFDDEHGKIAELGENICQLFNRRSFRRGARPGAGIDFAASVTPRTTASDGLRNWPVTVCDLSNVGASVMVDARTHSALEAIERFDLSLTLPGRDQESTIACIVRNRMVTKDEARYGCEYDWTETLDPLSVVEDLADYVIECLESSAN